MAVASPAISVRRLVILQLMDVQDATGQPHRPIVGATRLQKLVFLVQQRLPGVSDTRQLKFDFAFEPNRFGPADTGLYPDLEFLVALDFVSKRPTGETESEQEGPGLEEATERTMSFAYLMDDEDSAAGLAAAEGVQEEYVLTERGEKFLATLRGYLSDRDYVLVQHIRSVAEDVRRQYGHWPLERLLRFVYTEYPEFTTASEIRRRVLGHD